MVRSIHLAVVALAVTMVCKVPSVSAPCDEDAMIVFDASGSMAGNVGQGIGTTIPRIDEAPARACRGCHLGKELHAAAKQLTIHVIGYRVKEYSWTGEQSILDVRCLAEENGGLYIGTELEDDLIAALRKTLDCPMSTQRALP